MVDNATLAKLQEKKKSEVVPEEKPWYHHSKVRRYRYGGPLRVGLDIFVPLYWFRPLGNYKPVVTMSSCVYLGGYRYYDNPQDVTRQTFFLYDWEETSLPFDYAMVLSDGELSSYFWQHEYGYIDKSRFGGKKFHGVVLNVKDEEVTLACDDFVYDFPLSYFDHPVLPLQCVTFTITDYNQAIKGGKFTIRDMTIWEVAHEQITQMPFLNNTAFNFAIAARNLLKNKANLKKIANARKRNRINKKKKEKNEDEKEEIKDEIKENDQKDENDQNTEAADKKETEEKVSDKKENDEKETVEKESDKKESAEEADKNKTEKVEDVKNDQKEIDQKKGKDQKKESDKKNYQKKENDQKIETKSDKNKNDKNKTDKNKSKDNKKDDQKKASDQKNEVKEKETSKKVEEINYEEEPPTEQEKAIMMDVTKQLLEKLNIGIKRDSETPVKEDIPVEKETEKDISIKEAAISATDTDPEAPKDKKKPPKPKRPRKPREKKDSTKSEGSSNKETSSSPKKASTKEEPLSIKDLAENTKTEGNDENHNSNSSDKNRTDESVDGSPKKKQQRRRPRRRRSQREGNDQKTEVVTKENQGENKPSQD